MTDKQNSTSFKINYLLFFAFTFICFSFKTATAQMATSSPYSRYGVGDVYGRTLSQGFALGGTTIAVQNDTTAIFFINPANPASYSNLRLTTAELGLNYSRLQLQNQTTKSVTNSASLGYITLAFPIRKWWWGASIGLIPYSSVGYKVSDQQNITNVGKVDFLYEGSGGFNQAYFGNAIKPFYWVPKLFLKSNTYKGLISKVKSDGTLKTANELKQDREKAEQLYRHKKRWEEVSVGANVSYLFGSIENTGRTLFPGNYFGFNTKTSTVRRVNDFCFDYGAQYAFTIDSIKRKKYVDDTVFFHNPDSIYISKKLDPQNPRVKREMKEKVKILFGATFTAQTNVNAKIDSLSYSYFVNSAGYEIIKDTVVNVEGVKGNITLPLSFGFGLGFKKGDRWLLAADFAIQNWSSYQAFNQTNGLKNSMRTSLGLQYIPDSKAIGLNNYYKRLNYRMGLRYYQTAIEIKNTQLQEYALSIGIGFPVGRNYILQTFSMVNIGVEFGTRGTTGNGLIKENFMKATLGFTINDRWFQKPKFD